MFPPLYDSMRLSILSYTPWRDCWIKHWRCCVVGFEIFLLRPAGWPPADIILFKIWFFFQTRAYLKNAFYQKYPGTFLKNHSHDLHSPLCGEFIPNLINTVRYTQWYDAAYPWGIADCVTWSWCKYHTYWCMQIAEMIFKTRSGARLLAKYPDRSYNRVKKYPALPDTPPAAGWLWQHFPLRRRAILPEGFYLIGRSFL